MSGLIPHLSISQSHVFLLNSRLGHFSAPPSLEGPFSRSYRAILPSSLATDHSSAFGFSPRPPVSVSGTGRCGLALEVFLGSLFTTAVRSPGGPRYSQVRHLPADLPASDLPTPFNGLFRQPAALSLLRLHIATQVSAGILTGCPSTAPQGAP